MINIFRRKTLEEELNKTKTIKVLGMKFKIKKITPFDYLNGSESVLQFYQVYKTAKDVAPEMDHKKMQKLYTNIFLAGIVEPKIKRKNDESPGVFVDYLFTEWELAQKLYEEIFIYTYGKKKLFSAFRGSA